MGTRMTQPNPFVEFVESYHQNPVAFVQQVLGVEPDPWQAELLNEIAKGTRKLSYRSGHGVGKSSAASWAMIWFLLTRFPVKVVCTSPTSAQLFDALFGEVKKWVQELPEVLQALLETKTDRVYLKAAPNDAWISARTSRAESPEALQGVHSLNTLLVVDEASGVPEAVFEAGYGSMTAENSVVLLLGNPTRTSGFFFDTHHTNADQWFTRKVSCLDSPRVAPEYIEEMKLRYGPESNNFKIRVEGDFPKADDDTVIGLEIVESSFKRDVEVDEEAEIIWGLDVARFGSAYSVLCKRQGRVVTHFQDWKNLDLMQLTGAIKADFDAIRPSEQPAEILVDSIGVGGGVVDRLQELGLPAIGINTAEAPSMGTTYMNLRAELWFKVKAWLETREVRLPKDDKLLAELVSPRYQFTSAGKMKIESKDDMKKRGLPSPDKADALCLTFAGDAAIGLKGRGASTNWSQPLKRNIRGIV